MSSADINACGAKMELGLKTFRTTFSNVSPQWNDAASRDFQTTHLAPLEPNVRNMLEAIARLTEAVAGAERQCGSE